MPNTADAVLHPERKSQRDALRELKLCINGPMPMHLRTRKNPPPKPAHGPPVKAGKCQACIDTHAKTRDFVRNDQRAVAQDRLAQLRVKTEDLGKRVRGSAADGA